MIIIRSVDGFGRLEFSDRLPRDPSLPVNSFTATVTTGGLCASTQVYAYRFEGLLDLFDDLALSWRGWSGEKSWASLESEF